MLLPRSPRPVGVRAVVAHQVLESGGNLRTYAVAQVQGIEVHIGLAGLWSWGCAHSHAAVFSPADRVQAHRRAGDVFEAIGAAGQDRLHRVHAEAGVFPAQENLAVRYLEAPRIPTQDLINDAHALRFLPAYHTTDAECLHDPE